MNLTFRNTLRTIVIALLLCTVPLAYVFAERMIPCEGDACRACDLATLANNIIKFLIMMSILIGTIFIMYAGFLMVSAQGNQGNIEKARGIFTDVVVGILIILLSFLIVDTVMKMLVDPSFISGGKWNDLSSSCVSNPIPDKFAEKPVNAASVVPGGIKEVYAMPGSLPNGADIPPGQPGSATGATPTDQASAATNNAALNAAGVGTQAGVNMDGVSAARAEQVAALASACSVANGGTESSNACNLQVSSGFRQGAANHGTGDAMDLSGQSSTFNNWMRTQGAMTPTFGGYSGVSAGGGTCTWEGPDSDNPRGSHWHCSSTGR